MSARYLIAFFLTLLVCSSALISGFAQERSRIVTNVRTISQTTGKTEKEKKTSHLTPKQKLTAEQMTSFFENSTLEFQYGYAENLGDGRGITAGRSGFTTGTGDAYIVIKKYTEVVPNNPLAKYLPELKRLRKAEDKDDTENLESYESDWKLAAEDETFRRIQDEVNDELYFLPSQKIANKLDLNFALSRAALYDACIQHGRGDTADSLDAIVEKTNELLNGSPKDGIDEAVWLAKFLEVRKSVMLNPDDKDSQEEWADSVERVDTFITLLKKKNFELTLPMKITCYGDSVTIR